MEFDRIIKKRRSIREFKPKTPSWKDALESIDAALHCPFAGNINNLKFIILEDKSKIEKIAKHCKQHWISNSGLVIMVCSDDKHLQNLYGERGRVYSKQQAGAAVMTILLKLVDLDLSACWVGAFTDEILKNSLKIPAHIEIEAIIPIGYEKPSKTETKKRKESIKNAIFWEAWNKSRRPTIFESTDEDILG